LSFDLLMGAIQGERIRQQFDAYLFKRGNLWPVVLLVTAGAPFRNAPGPLRARARARLARNGQGGWSVAGMEVDLQLADPATSLRYMIALWRIGNSCIATESARTGIPVSVSDRDGRGRIVHATTPVVWRCATPLRRPTHVGHLRE